MTDVIHTPALSSPIPEGWRWSRLQDVCSVFDCPHSTPQLASEGSYIVRSQDIRTGVFATDGAARVSDQTYLERTSRAVPSHGDLLFSREGTYFGIAAEVPASTKVCLGQRMVLLRPNLGVLDFQFLKYWLNSPIMVRHVHGFRDGSVAERLNVPTIKSLPVVLPPIRDQQLVAQSLSMLDQKIGLNGRMNETLEAIVRAIFKSLFTEATSEGWRRANLSDVCEYILSGGTPSTKVAAYWDGEVPWLSSGETRNAFILDTDKKITRAGIENSSTRFARRGSTVIASAGQGHTRGQTSLLMIDSYVNQSVIALGADTRFTSDLYLFFDLERRYDEFRRVSDSQSSRGSLTTKLLGNLAVNVPPRELVATFDETVSPLVEQIRLSLEQNKTLASLRDHLLPKLLSGAIRLRDAEEVVEAHA